MTVSTLLSNAVYNAIGVRKDDELGASLRDALQVLIDDGTYETILTKWGVGGQGLLTGAVLATEADPNPVQK
jgi:polar amino acid transport system substrate-binding protein